MEDDAEDDSDDFRMTGLLPSCAYPESAVTEDIHKHTPTKVIVLAGATTAVLSLAFFLGLPTPRDRCLSLLFALATKHSPQLQRGSRQGLTLSDLLNLSSYTLIFVLDTPSS